MIVTDEWKGLGQMFCFHLLPIYHLAVKIVSINNNILSL
jgi:hypothetical protein